MGKAIHKGFSRYYNMHEGSLVAQRLVYDFVKLSGKELFEYSISCELRRSCKFPRQKYHQHLEQQNNEEKKNVKDSKQKLNVEDTIESLRKGLG